MTNPQPMPSLLANRYRVLKVLGDGGFGTTYLAEDSQMPSQRKCVVKQLKPVEDNPQIYQLVKERFQREAAILETLGDGFDQIPHLYAYFSEGEQFFLVEEWVEGQTLTQKVQQHGVLPEDSIRRILHQTLPVLSYIHDKRMVHRDIKPDNIILRSRDQVPVLIDFGAVKETMSTVVNSQGDSARSIVVGTPGFMPSEQMAGRPLFSSDLYSLGLTGIYLLTGRIPQDLETDPATGHLLWKHLAPQVTPGFSNLLDRAIQMNPRDRFQTAQQMQQALQSFEAETVVPSSPGVAPTELNTPQPPVAPSYPATTTPQYQPVTPPQAPPSYPPTPTPVPSSGQPTVQIPGVTPSTPTANPQIQPQSSGSGDWKKAGIIGGIIGLSILGGAMMLRAHIGDFVGNLGGNQEEVTPTPKPTPPTASPTPPTTPISGETKPAPISPVAPTPPSTPRPSPSPDPNWETDAQIIGSAGQKNIRSGPGTDFSVRHVAYPGDRVQVIGEDLDTGGFLWFEIYFPKSKAQGWIAGQLLKIDGQPVYTPPKEPDPPTPIPPISSDGNATIIGSAGAKNIRSGPGTEFETLHIAYPGDRIEILDGDIDNGGYQWFYVSFPKSGAEGWIASQLVQVDASP